MITYPISSNFCKKNYLQCYQLYNFPSWMCSIKLHSHVRIFLRKDLRKIFNVRNVRKFYLMYSFAHMNARFCLDVKRR